MHFSHIANSEFGTPPKSDDDCLGMIKERLIDLDTTQLDLLHTILNRHIPDKTVWAYGSRVTWKAGETSDLDLAVFGCAQMEIYDLKEALEESDLLISVDVMDWQSIPDDLKKNIRGKYVVLQEKSSKLAGWRRVMLKDVAEVNPKERILRNTKAPKVLMDFLVPHTKRIPKQVNATYKGGSKFRNGDTLLARITPCLENGKTGFVDFLKQGQIGFGSTEFIVIREKQDVTDKHYLYYLAVSDDFREMAVKSMTGTSGRQRVVTDEILRYKFLLPALPEQKAIAEVLSGLDDKIDLLHRQNKTLEAMAQALFRKSFTEPESRQWDTGTLPDEFAVTMGQSPPGISYNEKKEGTPLFQGNADFGFRFPKNRVYTTEPKRFAEKFDTLVSVRAPVGEQNMAQESCCIGRGVASFRYNKNQEFYSYTYYKMKSLMKEIKRFDQEGTVFGSISKDDFEKLEIVLPPNRLIRTFQNSVRQIDEKIYLNHVQIQSLENLRETLLPKLMSGEVRLRVGHRL